MTLQLLVDSKYREQTQYFVDWCQQNRLQTNARKTKEQLVEAQTLPPTPVNIQGMDIETVDSNNYLGVHLNNKLDWTDNITAMYTKARVDSTCSGDSGLSECKGRS